MKKALSTAVLVVGLFSGGNAYALNLVFDLTNFAKTTATAASTAATAISAEITAIKTSLIQLAWVKQAKDMIDSIQAAIDAKNKLTSELTGLRADAAGFVSKVSNPADPTKDVNYRYADKLPESYLPVIKCADTSTGCTVTGTGYKGIATPKNSADLRNELRVDPTKVGYDPLFGITKSILRIANEAAEQNAQEVAVIQAMAREAYTEANNRIVKIEELKKLLDSPPAGDANDLKYTADTQAQIQIQQTLLANEQNKLASLAVLQQSQRDMYEQRKKEIASYTKSGDRDASAVQSAERLLIATATAAAYTALNASY